MLKSKICLKAATSLAEVLFEGYGWMDARRLNSRRDVRKMLLI